MPVVEVEGKGTYEFPEGISEEEMQSAIDEHLKAPSDLSQVKPSPYEAADLAQPGIGQAAMGAGTTLSEALGRDVGPTIEKAVQTEQELREKFGASVLNTIRMATAPQASLTTGRPITSPPATPPLELGVSPLTPYLPMAAPKEKGIIPSLSRAVLGFTTPGNLITAPFIPGGGVGRAVAGYFGAQALAEIPKSLEEIATAKTPAETRGALTDLGLNLTLGGLMGRQALKKGIPNARSLKEAAEVHGDVRSLETPAEGLPAKEGGPGIQPPEAAAKAEVSLKPTEFESTESIVQRTQPGEQRDTAFTERAKTLKEASKNLKPGDIIIDEDGNRHEVDQVFTDGSIFLKGRDGEYHLTPSDKIESKATTTSLSPEEHGYLDAERKGIDVPVEIAPHGTSEGGPFARQIATIDREKGSIQINPGEFSAWLKGIPEAQRPQAVKSLLAEERFHLAADDTSAQNYWQSITGVEQKIATRRYTGNYTGLNPQTGQAISPTLLAHEALRYRMQQLARMTPRELAEAVGREKWTIKGLDAVESAIRGTREFLGTKASKEQQAIVDRMLGNVAAARTAMSGVSPDAIRKGKEEESKRLGVLTDADGRHHIPVTIERTDGTTYQAQFNGYYDLREIDGGTPESIGYQLPSGEWTHGGLHSGEKLLTKIPEIDQWNGLFEPKEKMGFATQEEPAALRKKKGEAQPELYLPPLPKGAQVERPGPSDLGAPKAPATPQGATIHPQDLAHETDSIRPAFNEITPDQAKNVKALSGILTDDAREFQRPVSETKRVTVMENKKTGAVEALSTFRDPRRGAVVLDPDTGRHVPLAKALQTYRPVASLLLKETVKNFRQKFNSLQDFESQFAQPAREGASGAYQEPPAALETETELRPSGATTGKSAVPGQFQQQPGTFEAGEAVPLTDAEAGAVRDHIINEVGNFDSPGDVKASLNALGEDMNRQAVSGYRKLSREIQRQNPELTDAQVIDRLAQQVYEDHSQSSSKEDFIRRAMAKGDPENSQAAGIRQKPADVQTPAAIRKVKAAAKDELVKVTMQLRAWTKRIPTDKELAATRDAADNSAHILSDMTQQEIRSHSMTPKFKEGNPEVLAAANALVQSGFDQSKLAGFKTATDNGIAKAKAMIASGSLIDARIGRKWLKGQMKLKAELDYADAHWSDPELQNTAGQMRRELDDIYKEEQRNGYNYKQDENYLPGRYDAELFNDNAVLFKGLKMLGSQWRAPKTFETYYHAGEAGPYVAMTRDGSAIVGHRVRQGLGSINRKKWFELLKSFTDEDSGQPVARDAVLRPDGTYAPPDTEHILVHPVNGHAPIAIRKGFAKIVSQLTSPSKIQDFTAAKAVLEWGQMLKHTMLMGDFFHLGRLVYYSRAIMGNKMDFKGGLHALEYRPSGLARAVARGVVSPETAAWVESPVTINTPTGPRTTTRRAISEDFIRKGLNVGRIQDAIYKDLVANVPFFGRYNKFLFDKLTRGFMMQAAVTEFERINNAHPTLNNREIIKQVSSDINNFYGSIGRQGWIKSATFQDLARIPFLAPQWIEGLVKKEATAYTRLLTSPKRVLSGQETMARGIGRGMVAMLVLTQVLNLITRRKPTWQNEEPEHNWDAALKFGDTTVWVSPLSIFNELGHDLVRYYQAKPKAWDAIDQIGSNKLGPWGRLALVLKTSQSETGERITTTPGVLSEAAKRMIPVPISFGKLAQVGGNLIAPSLVPKPAPGSVPRQLLGSAGVKAEVDKGPSLMVQKMAEDFVERNGLKKETGWMSIQTDQPGYTKLRAALRNGDEEQAKRIFEQLKVNRKESDIYKAMKMWSKRPFAGSRKNETLFLDSLTDKEREMYLKATLEKQQLLETFNEFYIRHAAGN